MRIDQTFQIFWFCAKILYFAKKKFCRFPTVASRSDPHLMINPSIESSNFLLWHEEKKLISDFENFVGNRQIEFHEFKVRACKHILNFILWNSVCLFPIKVTKSEINFFFSCQSRKLELSIDGLIIYESLRDVTVGKRQKNVFFEKLVKIVPWAPFWISSL